MSERTAAKKRSCSMSQEKHPRTPFYYALFAFGLLLTVIIVWTNAGPLTKSSWQESTSDLPASPERTDKVQAHDQPQATQLSRMTRKWRRRNHGSKRKASKCRTITQSDR
jgi:hypothetical protein